MSTLIASQVSCMLLLLVGTFGFGTLPIFVQKNLFRCDCDAPVCLPNCRARRGKLITSFLIYLGGGVLLGTTFLHLLPESREGFEIHNHGGGNDTSNGTQSAEEGGGEVDQHHEEFPIPEFVVCVGFFAVYLFEEVMHWLLSGRHKDVPREHKAIRSMSRSGSCSPPPDLEHAFGQNKRNSIEITRPNTMSTDDLVAEGGHSHIPSTFSVGALLTVAALSFHSLFEGFAVGLRPDATSTWIVFVAVAVHKYVISFVVGLEVLATGGKNLHVFSYMGVFSMMSPLGMAIAMVTQTNVEDTNPIVVSVLNGIATGTLLYVTFFEILQRHHGGDDKEQDLDTWVQLAATVAGFTLIALVQFGSTFA